MAIQPPSTDSIISQLERQLQNTESRFVELQQEKAQMETDFEYKRSKIKELYYAKENTIREQNAKLFEASRQISQLEAVIKSLKEEIENVKMIASVSEDTKQEAVENLKKHHLEDIESLKCVLQDTFEDQRQDLLTQFDRERRHWEAEKLKIEEENTNLNQMLAEVESTSKANEEKYEDGDEGLESSMKKAQSEAEYLKSVVVPLEQEILDLKQQLKLSSNELQHVKQQASLQHNKQELLVETYEKDSGSSNSASDSEIRRVNDSLKSEKSSRSDLEVYIDVLQKQQLVLQRENDILKTEMHEVCRTLETEQADHSMLKATWNRANEHFIMSQDQFMKDVNIIKDVLTIDQKKKLTHLKHIQLTPFNQDEKSHQNASMNGINDTTGADNISFEPFQHHEIPEEPTTLESNLNIAPELQDSISISSVLSVPEMTTNMPPTDTFPARVNSAPQLNDIGSEKIQRSNTDITTELDWNIDSPARRLKILRMKETEIDRLQIENSQQQDEIKRLKSLYDTERKLRVDLEESVTTGSEEARKQIKNLFTKIDEVETRLEEDQLYRRNKEREDNEKLTSVASDRDRIREHFIQVKKEQDAMRSSFERCRNSLNKESNTPTSVEGLRINLQRYREAYAAIQVDKMHAESDLQNRISFLESTIEVERTAKEQIEAALTSDLEDAQRKVSSLHNLHDRLQRETAQHQELKVQVEKDQLSMESIRSKSKEIIKSLKDKLHIETTEKAALEGKLSDAKNQLRSLQEALETSEHVQRDFVKLSQSLQVQLEEIRLQEEAKDVTRPDSSSSPNHLQVSHSAPGPSSDQPG